MSRREVARVTGMGEHRQRRIEKALGRAGVPMRYHRKGFDDYRAETETQRRVRDALKAFAENFADNRAAGRWLVLCGGPGTGKTHLACAALGHVIDAGWSGAFLTVTELLTIVRDSYRRDSERPVSEVVSELVRPDLLALDEVGVQKGDAAEQRILFDVLGRRYNDMKPTLLIGNVTAAEMGEFLGDRIMDRVHEAGGAVIPFNWSSWRRK